MILVTTSSQKQVAHFVSARNAVKRSILAVLTLFLCLSAAVIFGYSTCSVALASTEDLASLTPVTDQLQTAYDTVNVRSGPGTNHARIGQVHLGDIIQAKAKDANGWYQIDWQEGTGWIAGWCVQAYQQTSTASAQSGTQNASRGTVSDVISIAKRFLGKPYQYGASGPSSFDCSGFVRYVYSLYGVVDLPRVASDQARAGQKVSPSVPGDLVFFSDRKDGYITHVGIYVGNNSFIHASSFRGVTITSLDEAWYKSRYVSACRIL